MIKKISFIALLFFCNTRFVFAQSTPVVITNATIHVGNGLVIQNGLVGFDSGKIVFVDSVMRNSYKNATIIDAKGKHIYPGLFLLNTYLGLNEIDAVRATRDYLETGDINPNVRALIAYNTDSKIIPTAQFNGILHMQVVPSGGLISGTSCVVKTEADNWEDAAIINEDGIHVNWPEANGYYQLSGESAQRLVIQKNKLQQFFEDAKQYGKLTNKEVNLRLASMKEALFGQKRIYFHVSTPEGILEVISFCKKNQIPNPVLVASDFCYLVAEEIKQSGIPVILNVVHRLPAVHHQDIDQPYKTAAILVKKGILVALGLSGSWESRNIMFQAGTCAAYGLTKEQALALITDNAAKITGCDNVLGTISTGKLANIVISEGDILDMKTSIVTHIFIEGNQIKVWNSQTELYEQYSKKYGIETK